jgi:hypothetical protein
LCDEVVVVVGNSDDGTHESVKNLNDKRIKIIETIWDETLREGGKILAQQTNIALDNIQGKWGLYIQGDEVLHERDYDIIKRAAEKYQDDNRVEGLIFNYLHFYGNYNYIRDRFSKRAYPYEIRMIKNKPGIRSYLDAQGFRCFETSKQVDEQQKPRKLNAIKIPAYVYHYGMVRTPEQELERQKSFHKLWHSDDWVEDKFKQAGSYDYHTDSKLEVFNGTHPALMQKRIEKLNWDFRYNPKLVQEPLRYKIANRLGKLTGRHYFYFKNYKVIGSFEG